MKYQHRILSLLACLMCATIAFSQVKIIGKVVDAAGEPIEFATVRLMGTAVGTNTDIQGQYAHSVTFLINFHTILVLLGWGHLEAHWNGMMF